MSGIRSFGYDVQPPVSTPVTTQGGSPGNMTIGSYQYKITFVSHFGETTTGPASTPITTTTGSMDLSIIPTSNIDKLVSRRIYRSSVGDTPPFKLVAVIGDIVTTTYTDITADVARGSDEPVANFAHSIEKTYGFVQHSKGTVRSCTSVSAAGVTQSTATAIGQDIEIAIVDPVVSGNGVRLPTIGANLIGLMITIRNNDAVNLLNVYPFEATSTIDTLGVGAAVSVAAASTQRFIIKSDTTWQTVSTTGGGGGGGGVTSITGTVNQVIASASTGVVTLSTPQDISTTSTPTFNQITITNAPVSQTDATSKLYVDSAISGLTWKAAAEAATTGDLTTTYNNGTAGVGATLTNAGVQAAFITDTYAGVVGDRILVKEQIDQTQNGIYEITTVGTGASNWILTRTSDADNSPINEVDNIALFVKFGATLAATAWTQTTDSVVLGVSNVVFAQFSSGSSGESNTASNQGVAGVGIFIQKTGSDLEFKNINTGSSKITITNDGIGNEIDIDVSEGNVNHNSLLNFVSNEHVDHSGVTITAGIGLTGGGDITANRTIDLDINGLVADAAPVGSTDYIVTYDASAGTHKKVLIDDLPSGIVDVVNDSAATPTYPQDLTKGVWYGLNTKANAFDTTCVTLGRNAATGAINAVAIGDGATATGLISVAINGSALGNNSISVGGNSGSATSFNNISMGGAGNIYFSGNRNIIMGSSAFSASANFNGTITGSTTLTLDSNPSTNFIIGMTISGTGITAGTTIVSLDTGILQAIGSTYTLSLACTNGSFIDGVSFSNGSNNIAIGLEALYRALSDDNVVIGRQSGSQITTGNQNTAMGSFISISAATSRCAAYGHGSTAGTDSTAVGAGSSAAGVNCIALGRGSLANFDNTVSIGQGVSNPTADSVMIGTNGDRLVNFRLPTTNVQTSNLTNTVLSNGNQGTIELFSTLAGGQSTTFNCNGIQFRTTSIVTATVETTGTTRPCVVGISLPTDGVITITVYNLDVGATATAPKIHYSVYYTAF